MTSLAALVAPVALLYFVFAFQLFRDTKDAPDTRAKRAMRMISVVFVFCGGVHVAKHFGAPFWLLAGGYAAIIIAMTWIIVMREGSHLARALDRMDDLS